MADQNQSNSLFLDSLNNVAEYKPQPTKKLANLNCGEKYEVIKIRAVDTGYGRAIVIHLLDTDKKEFQTFLPKRMVQFLDRDEVIENFTENVKYMQVSKVIGLKNVSVMFFR